MKITIYSKPNCPYCTKAKFIAEHHQDVSEVRYLMLGEDYETNNFMAEFPTARTFPQIIVNGTKIGGYTDLEKFLNSADEVREALHGGDQQV